MAWLLRERGRSPGSGVGIVLRRLVALLVGLLVGLSPAVTTTSGAATYTYDARSSTRADYYAIDVACAATTSRCDARERSASPSGDARRTSTTPDPRSVATNTADDVARVVDDLPTYGSTPGGRPYTKHYGTETGPQRNIPGSVVDEAIDNYPGKLVDGGKTVHYDSVNDITVVTGNGGSIVSVHKGQPRAGQR